MFSKLYGNEDIKIQYQVVWNKLYRKELLNGLSFKKTASEDTNFNTRVYLRVHNAILIDIELYYWIQRPNSITHTAFIHRAIDCINSYKLCLDEIPALKKTYRAWCLKALYKVILHTRYNSRKTPLYDETMKVCKDVYRQTFTEFIHCNLGWFKKVGVLCLYYRPELYCFLRSLLSFANRIR